MPIPTAHARTDRLLAGGERAGSERALRPAIARNAEERRRDLKAGGVPSAHAGPAG